MYDIKLKATNEYTRNTNKQKLINIDNSMVVTRGEESGKGCQIYLTLGSRYTMQHMVHVSEIHT